MNFPDKPIVTAGLGIVCALALLAFLSWPGLASANPMSATSNNPGFATSKQGQPDTMVQSAVTTTTAVESSATSGSIPAANNSNLYGAGSSNAPTEISSSSAQTAVTSATTIVTTVEMVTTIAYSETTTNANAAAQPVFALAQVTGVSSGQNHTSSYTTLIILSISSVAIAVGSMLFIKRRVDPGREIEPEIANS